jgi:hypothetical protein
LEGAIDIPEFQASKGWSDRFNINVTGEFVIADKEGAQSMLELLKREVILLTKF